MSRIAEVVYDRSGRVVEPLGFDVRQAKIGLAVDSGRIPTFDRGYTHVQSLTDTGLSRDEANMRMKRLLRRFFGDAEMVTGFRKIAVHRTEGVIPCNRNYQITCDVIYAVEDTARRRSHKPGPPDEGSLRGAGREEFIRG